MMEYKGYLGMVAYDAAAKIFHGDIVNTRDVITFQGTTVAEIEKSFRDSINRVVRHPSGFEQLPLKIAKYYVFCRTCETTKRVVEQA